MAISKIEWTEMTWNPTTGCSKISPGCKNCYAETLSLRLQAMGLDKYRNGFKVTLHPDELPKPYSWKKSKIVFVNSMSDLFHKDIPLEFIQRVFNVMNDCHWHIFQVLTKREDRLLELNSKLNWSANIWMGVSIENQDYTYRMDYLKQTDAKVKFLSLEPLLGPLYNMNLNMIDWVIVGGESGPKARPIKKQWVEDIRKQCRRAKVKFFFKQWGGFNKKENGRELNGRTYDEIPLDKEFSLQPSFI